MKKLKKIMGILLILSIFINNSSNLLVYANDKIKEEVTNESNVQFNSFINPLYDHLGSQLNYVDFESSQKPAGPFTSMQEAANYMKGEMVKRKESISFSLKSNYYKGMDKDIYKQAISEDNATNSSEGDYLRTHFKEYKVKIYYKANNVQFNFNLKYLSTYEQEQEVNKKVKALLDELNVYNASEYKKIKAVHDYVVSNIEYDNTYSRYSGYNAIVNNSVVCQGFASLTYKMLKELGVGVRYINGMSNGDRHGWNIVRINNKWYNIDNTWDENLTVNNNISYKYFLKSEKDFENHTRNEDFLTNEFNQKYPMASNSYVYTEQNENTDTTSGGLTDIKGHWAEKEIKQFVLQGHIKGYNDKTFKPNNSITRAEFVKVVNNVFGYTEKSNISFKDVKKGIWYYDEVAKAVKAGYITGRDKNTFAPDDKITREEVAKILTTIKKNKDYDYDKLDTFKDGDKTSNWAKPFVEGAIEAGYLKGDDNKNLNPTSNISRAESVTVLSRLKK